MQMKKWYQSKLIATGVLAVLTAVLGALSSAWDWKLAVIAGLGALVIVLRKYFTDTGLVSLLFVAVVGTSGCSGSIGQFAKDHQDEIAQLEQCALQCGTDIAIDTLSCPITGGNLKDLVDVEVAKGMAQTAGTCILSCLASRALVEVCKKDK
jgi:hypothetical protein